MFEKNNWALDKMIGFKMFQILQFLSCCSTSTSAAEVWIKLGIRRKTLGSGYIHPASGCNPHFRARTGLIGFSGCFPAPVDSKILNHKWQLGNSYQQHPANSLMFDYWWWKLNWQSSRSGKSGLHSYLPSLVLRSMRSLTMSGSPYLSLSSWEKQLQALLV